MSKGQANIAAMNEVFLTALESDGKDGCLQVMQHMQLFLTGYSDSSILLFIDVISDAIFVVGRVFNVFSLFVLLLCRWLQWSSFSNVPTSA